MERKGFEEALARKRILSLIGEITREKVENLRAWLQFLNIQSKRRTIKLIFDSPGGEVSAAFRLYDAILLSKAPVIGIVNGECSSAAVVILQATKKRLATEHSLFLIHPVVINFGKLRLNEKIKKKIDKKLEKGKKRQTALYQILMKKTGKTLKEIKANEEKIMTAKEAKEFGLIDEVIERYKI